MGFWNSLFGSGRRKNDLARSFSGGDGSSLDKALIVHAANSGEGVPAEYRYLIATFGRKDVDWSVHRKLLQESNGRHYDIFNLKLKDGQKKDVYFDITSFYGQF